MCMELPFHGHENRTLTETFIKINVKVEGIWNLAMWGDFESSIQKQAVDATSNCNVQKKSRYCINYLTKMTD